MRRFRRRWVWQYIAYSIELVKLNHIRHSLRHIRQKGSGFFGPYSHISSIKYVTQMTPTTYIGHWVSNVGQTLSERFLHVLYYCKYTKECVSLVVPFLLGALQWRCIWYLWAWVVWRPVRESVNGYIKCYTDLTARASPSSGWTWRCSWTRGPPTASGGRR